MRGRSTCRPRASTSSSARTSSSTSPPPIWPDCTLEAKRVLRPGGLAVHRFNPQDHFARRRPSITGANFLRFSARSGGAWAATDWHRTTGCGACSMRSWSGPPVSTSSSPAPGRTSAPGRHRIGRPAGASGFRWHEPQRAERRLHVAGGAPVTPSRRRQELHCRDAVPSAPSRVEVVTEALLGCPLPPWIDVSSEPEPRAPPPREPRSSHATRSG